VEDVSSQARDEAQEAAEKERSTDRLVQMLVDRIGGRTGVQALFGEPVERDGITVVPVGRLRWAFGAGGGSGPMSDDSEKVGSGSGAGGLAIADPVGYLEIGPSGATFRAIVGFPPNPLAILAIGITVALVLRSVIRLIGR
jgi:hypothetical protein